jgi:hypothetical protein
LTTLAAIAQPLEEAFSLQTVHHAMPRTAAAGRNRISMVIIVDSGVVPSPADELRPKRKFRENKANAARTSKQS